MTATMERTSIASMAKPEPIVGIQPPTITARVNPMFAKAYQMHSYIETFNKVAEYWDSLRYAPGDLGYGARPQYTEYYSPSPLEREQRRADAEQRWAAESERRQKERDHAARLVYDLRLKPDKRTLVWQDGNFENHEAECLFLENVSFHESSRSLCGTTPAGGYMRGTMVENVVGFMRKGFPVQRGRYNASYGWNVQRAGRAYVEGKSVLFD